MTTDPSPDKAPDQSAPANAQVEKAQVPPKEEKPVVESPAVSPAPEKAATPAAPKADQPMPDAGRIRTVGPKDPTIVHMAPVAPAQEASPAPAAPAAPAEKPEPKDQAKQAADETIPRKPSTDVEAPKVTAAPIVPPVAQSLPDVENPYILSGDVDRARLVAQARLFRGYLEANAKRLIGEKVERILDIGCAEGQLTQVFARLYPEAHVVGLDTDDKAVEAARRSAHGITNLEFVVGDAQVSLPPGPFDVIYESMSLLHMRNAGQVIQLAFQALKPGGLLWLKEGDARGFMTAFTHPTYRRLVDLLISSMAKLGADASVAMKLPEMLGKAGFADIRTETETYPIGNTSTEARITMVSQIGVLYNARQMMSKVQNIPVSEIETMYRQLLDALMAPAGPVGQWPFMNIIAHRPLQPPVSGNGQQTEATTVVTPSAAPLADVENPYILSSEVDRARLVAQTRLFRQYIEENAKRFIGENIKSVLDLGCGEGQLTLVFARLYPGARIVGIDRDEKAIEVAKRAAKGMPNVEFQVGDVQEHLPAGPFDLIYESLVLLHVAKTAQTVKLAYDALRPGGYFWSKEFHPMVRTAVNHPAYLRLMDWMNTSMARIGGHLEIATELPDVLAAAGFTNFRKEEQILPLGNMNAEARITMSVNLGAIYNARKLVSKMLQIPESEIEKNYKELVDSMMAPGGPKGEYLYINTIAQRPA